ncbi:MAG: hypothetical protein L0220_14020 [Acidobacteria bacterium]|nr:hypothetical protein [Acidobacteriota bacterium]
MSNSILDQLREAARRKAQEIDEKYDLKNKINQGVDTAGKVASEAAGTVRERFDKLDEQFNLSQNIRAAADKTGEAVREGAQVAEDTTREIFGSAKNYYHRAEQAYDFTAKGAAAVDAAVSGFDKARSWIKENPGKTAVVSFSMIAGVRAVEAIPALGMAILGSGGAGSWFFNSALPIVGIGKLTEKYNDYLKEQETLLAEGKLDEAKRSQIEFQRNMVKYVGAPLLGTFSIAAGATMIGAAFSGATVSGFPISLILGANPLLNGIWFFANGVVCINEGVKFFMIALADQEEVERVVREIKGMLPAAT